MSLASSAEKHDSIGNDMSCPIFDLDKRHIGKGMHVARVVSSCVQDDEVICSFILSHARKGTST